MEFFLTIFFSILGIIFLGRLIFDFIIRILCKKEKDVKIWTSKSEPFRESLRT